MLRAALAAGRACIRVQRAPRCISECSARALSNAAHPYENFLSGTNGNYVDEMYYAWKENPESVHKSWQVFFQNVDAGKVPGTTFTPPPTINAGSSLIAATVSSSVTDQEMQDTIKVMQLVRSYQHGGHHIADLDPLGLSAADLDMSMPAELVPENYGFTEADMEREFDLSTFMMSGFLSDSRAPRKLKDILQRLQETYATHIGVEYMHIDNQDQQNWIRERVETPEKFKFTKEEKLRMLDRLAWSDHFERFLASKWSTVKRFGLEGCETLIPCLKELVDHGVDLGIKDVVLGMPHRGRLNVLANVVRKPMEQIFAEFQGIPGYDEDDWSGSGDVKYHLGMSYQRETISGKSVHLSLVANPSHLEAVNPVVEGKTRAKQHYSGDTERHHAMSLLLHGDAAFSGQGIVFETIGLSDLYSYSTGGTVHVVVNNQIGFTTDPRSSRSSPYSTDIGKVINAPIFHVNGDDTEAVCLVARWAAEWRQTWKSDVIIDIVCYRKHGHNELDQPMFTQPLMYKVIKQQPSAWQLYSKKLIDEGTCTPEEVQAISQRVTNEMERVLEESREYKAKGSDWLSSNWSGMLKPNQTAHIHDTGLPEETLRQVGTALSTLPEGFQPHKKIQQIYGQRLAMIEKGAGLDWAMGEALAFGTLLVEGNHVRISGQDVERGTFSHRHAVVHDQRDNNLCTPLNQLSPTQAEFQACNSSLSEFAVLGFELGYSLENPNALICWEAQFGDFSNTAQCIIDQFISSGEQKWLRQSGLVMLLPHGFDGQGPEHSSARLERFLQMCDDEPDEFPEMSHDQRQQIQLTNWQVCNVTTPANYFHLLRRQVHRDFRKPLIVMSPKNLLRHRQCVSDFADISSGTRFLRFIPDDGASLKGDVRRVLLCSGKVYYDLIAERERLGATDVAISRVEQLCPFPFDKVKEECLRYPDAEVVWVQEEHKNAGAWNYVDRRIETALRGSLDQRPRYVGRGPAAATATGSPRSHAKELQAFLDKAFS